MKCDKCNNNVSKLNHHKEEGFLCGDCYRAVYEPETYIFRSYWDQSLGVMIDSPFKKKELERKHGVIYMSNNERIAATKEAQRSLESKRSYTRRKDIKNIFDNVQNGYSYIKNLRNRGII